MSIVRTVRAELKKDFKYSFFTSFMLFFNLVLPFGLGLSYYFIYLPFPHQMLNVQGFDISLLDFTVAGQIIYLLFVNMILIGSYFTEERFRGTLETIFLTPCNRFALLFGGSLAGLLNYVWFLAGLSAVVLMLGIRPHIHSYGAVLLSLFLAIFSTVVVGMLFQVFFVSSRQGSMWGTFLQEPVIFVSGLVFPLQYAPRFVQLLASAVPLSYAVLAFRAAVFAGATASDLYSVFVFLAVLSLIYIAITVYYVHLVDFKLRKEGTFQLF